MPRLSDTVTEGVLSQWVKHEGGQVRKGDVLAVIETDKAAMDMEAYDEGVLTRVLVAEGASVPIGAPVAVIGEAVAEAAEPSPVPACDHRERTHDAHAVHLSPGRRRRHRRGPPHPREEADRGTARHRALRTPGNFSQYLLFKQSAMIMRGRA